MDDEMREKLIHMIGYEDWGDKTAEDVADDILSLLAPVIEAAELWEKVEELARYKGDCGYCKNDDLCMKFPSSACYICEGVVHALKEDPDGN